MKRSAPLVGFAALFAAQLVLAAPPFPWFTDPVMAGPDFGVQGEYVGEVKFGDNAAPAGVQVIALGRGEFTAALYRGGLPGDGWKRGDRKDTATGKTATPGGVVTLSAMAWTGSIKDGVLSVQDSDGKAIGALKKSERKSPTLGAKPPKDALVLFDGTSAEHWGKNRGRKVEVTDDKLLPAGANTKRKFTDYTLHLEFRTPYMPEASGQWRGNSGVYLSSHTGGGDYEIQVLDSFGLDGVEDECGAFYKKTKPLVNMCLPPLAWQTYDVEFTAARVNGDGKLVKPARATVKHNGVVIHDGRALTGTVTGTGTGMPVLGGIILQEHCPVYFRNIWLVEK